MGVIRPLATRPLFPPYFAMSDIVLFSVGLVVFDVAVSVRDAVRDAVGVLLFVRFGGVVLCVALGHQGGDVIVEEVAFEDGSRNVTGSCNVLQAFG